MEVYDITSDTWSNATPMPTARTGSRSIVHNTQIYVFGGLNNSSGSSKALGTTEVYDPLFDEWSTKTNMPTPRATVALGKVNGKIYTVAGWDPNNNGYSAVNEVYDPLLDNWTTMRSLPVANSHPSSSVVDDILYIIGGHIEGKIPVNTVWVYNGTVVEEKTVPLTTSWGQGPFNGYNLNPLFPSSSSPCSDYNSDNGDSFVYGCTALAVGQLINYYYQNGFADGWLDVMLQNVHVYPRFDRSWPLQTVINDCIHTGFITEDRYVNTLAEDSNGNLGRFLWNVAIGLDSKFKKLDSTIVLAYEGGEPYDWVDRPFHKLKSLLIDRFKFKKSIEHSSVIYKLNEKKDYIFHSIENGHPVLFFLTGKVIESGEIKGHFALIYGYRILSNDSIEYLINFGWNGDSNTNTWYPGNSDFESPKGKVLWYNFVLLTSTTPDSLSKTINILKIIANKPEDTITSPLHWDVNNDGTAGLAEAIHEIRSVAGETIPSQMSGVFYNLITQAGGEVDLKDLDITGNNLSGHINFTQRSEDPYVLCGAGNLTTLIEGTNVNGSFISNDLDNGCGFDHGGIFNISGSMTYDRSQFWGDYEIQNNGGSSLLETNGVFEMWKDLQKPTSLSYTGTFLNTMLNSDGTVILDILVGQKTVSGYMDFTNSPDEQLLCGAGYFVGAIEPDKSIEFSFISNDPDEGCGFDKGDRFVIDATISSNRDTITGDYRIGTNVLGNFTVNLSENMSNPDIPSSKELDFNAGITGEQLTSLEGKKYYRFTLDETATIAILSTGNLDLQGKLYELNDGELVELDVDSDGIIDTGDRSYSNEFVDAAEVQHNNFMLRPGAGDLIRLLPSGTYYLEVSFDNDFVTSSFDETYGVTLLKKSVGHTARKREFFDGIAAILQQDGSYNANDFLDIYVLALYPDAVDDGNWGNSVAYGGIIKERQCKALPNFYVYYILNQEKFLYDDCTIDEHLHETEPDWILRGNATTIYNNLATPDFGDISAANQGDIWVKKMGLSCNNGSYESGYNHYGLFFDDSRIVDSNWSDPIDGKLRISSGREPSKVVRPE